VTTQYRGNRYRDLYDDRPRPLVPLEPPRRIAWGPIVWLVAIAGALWTVGLGLWWALVSLVMR
jgi:hypothetical protein